MKRFLLGLISLASMSSFASGSVECFNQAKETKDSYCTNIKTNQAIKLCSGSESFSPIECFNEAKGKTKDSYGTYINTNQAIKLCSGSESLSPIECFNEAKKIKDFSGSYLNTNQAIELCAQRL